MLIFSLFALNVVDYIEERQNCIDSHSRTLKPFASITYLSSQGTIILSLSLFTFCDSHLYFFVDFIGPSVKDILDK
jgi:hypothetical protein